MEKERMGVHNERYIRSYRCRRWLYGRSGGSCGGAGGAKSVLLVEKNGYLGGAACANYVNPFMDF